MKETANVTIYDISRESGVSIATVSRVINGSEVVSPATREKVLRVIEERGYKPNAFARGLGLNTMKTIGLLCADASDTFIAQAISYLEKGLRDNGYDSLLCCTGTRKRDRQKSLDLLLSKHVDGVVLVGSTYVSMKSEGNSYILEAAEKIPVAIVNARLDGENIYCSYCDEKTATQQAAQKLLRAGKRRILCLYYSSTYSGVRKLDGYKQAHEAMGIPVDDSLLIYCEHTDGVSEVKAALEKLEGLQYDAIMTATDAMAVGALKYLRTKQIRVPEEMPIIGFNNSPICLCAEPELTSIDNKLQSMCQTCVSVLMGVLAGEERPKSSVFAGELVERGTTAF